MITNEFSENGNVISHIVYDRLKGMLHLYEGYNLVAIVGQGSQWAIANRESIRSMFHVTQQIASPKGYGDLLVMTLKS